MNKYEQFYSAIISDIGEKRFGHSVRTAECARKLAERWNVDPDKAHIAGIFHDCGKLEDRSQQRKEAMKYEELSDFWGLKSINVLHAKLGVVFARDRYGIDDIDILNAISYHTTGRAGMSMLEKLIFVADCIEPGRSFEDVELIRSEAQQSIDRAVSIICARTIIQLTEKFQHIEHHTLDAYNYYLEKR